MSDVERKIDLMIVHITYDALNRVLSEFQSSGTLSKQTIIECKRLLPEGYSQSFSKGK